MAELATERMVVAASPDRCYAVASDIERYPEWAAEIKQVVIEARDAEGRAASVRFRTAAFGRSTNYTLAYDYTEAPRVLAWRLTEGDITAKLDGCYVFDRAEGGGTEVTYHLEVELRVPLPGFIKMRAQSRIMSLALRQLRLRAESTSGAETEAPPSSGRPVNAE